MRWIRSWILKKLKMGLLFPDLIMKKMVRQDLSREQPSALLYLEVCILQIIQMIPIRQWYLYTKSR